MFTSSHRNTDAVQHQGQISGIAIADPIELDPTLKDSGILPEVCRFRFCLQDRAGSLVDHRHVKCSDQQSGETSC